MGMLPAAPFQDYFAMLTEPRGPDAPNSRHQLMAILLMAVRAVLGGAAGWEDIAAYGMVHAKWCADRFDLPHCRMAFPGMTRSGEAYRGSTPRNGRGALARGRRP